jgi:hypothetical protein
MTHALIEQYRFARDQFRTGIEGVSAEEGLQRIGPMNSIGWVVGHLAAFDQIIWCIMAQDLTHSEAVKACASGKPASTPPLPDMVADWNAIKASADTFLNTLEDQDLSRYLQFNGRDSFENIGTTLRRQTWHYWYHLGEVQAVRQMLGHSDLPAFVGQIPTAARVA